MKPITFALALAVALAGTLAWAQSPKPESGAKKTEPGGAAMPMPKAPAELAQFKIFLGNWKCEGKAPDSPMGPAHATHTTVSARMDLDNFWMMFHVEEKKTRENPAGIKGTGYWTYDASTKRFGGPWVDNVGVTGNEWSAGWQGDTISFEGEMTFMGQKMQVRDVFTKKSDREMTHKSEAAMKPGQWTTMAEETCKK